MEYEKFEKAEKRIKRKKMWEVKVKVIPVINGVLGTMAPKLEK